MPDVSATTTMQTLPHPVPRYADRIQLVRFRRGPDARRWEARVKLPDGKWSPYFSLGTEDRDEACHNAVEELARREGLHRDGRPQPARVAKTGPVRPERTFMDAALPVLERLEKQRNDAKGRLGGNKGNKFESHISCIRNVLCPAFGDTPVADLTRKALNEWARGLTVKGRRGAGEKAPSQNTIGNYNHSLQLVLDRAVELGWIDEEDKPSISKKGFAEAVSTPWLTPDEVERLRDHMTDAWVAAAHDQQSSREVRYLLRAYVALCSCTGIRPGEELERILPNQVIHEGRGKQAFIRIPVVSHKGKKPRPRDVIVFENDAFDVREVLEGLAGWRAANRAPPRSPLFALPSTGAAPNFAAPFKRLMEETGLLIDPETGLERVPYSLRHYFATQALLRGEDDHTVARWMGTSVAMLERTYNKIKLRMLGARLAGKGKKDALSRTAALLRRQQGDEQPDIADAPDWWRHGP